METTIQSVKERPLLFSGPMALAIDLGHKTMTRRLARPQPESMDAGWPDDDSHICWDDILDDPGYYLERSNLLPYGKVGDLIWVRETYRVIGWQGDFSRGLVQYQADGQCLWLNLNPESGRIGLQMSGLKAYAEKLKKFKPVYYKTTDQYVIEDHGKDAGPWRSSLYMPRWASRNLLRLTSIKAERLQEITLEDLIREGMTPSRRNEDGSLASREDLLAKFIEVWNGLHDRFAWASDPWVFALGFEKVT